MFLNFPLQPYSVFLIQIVDILCILVSFFCIHSLYVLQTFSPLRTNLFNLLPKFPQPRPTVIVS